MKTEIPPTLRRLSRQIADEMDYLDKERFIDETTTPGGDLVSIVAVFRGDEADRMRDVLAPSPPKTPAPRGSTEDAERFAYERGVEVGYKRGRRDAALSASPASAPEPPDPRIPDDREEET